MELVFDNIIYSKERQGGISNYWFEITKGFAKDNLAHFYEEKSAITNIFRKRMTFSNVISHRHLPLTLARLLPITYQTNTANVLYHSSFYRKLISNAKICEITTVHDFLHQKHSSTPLNKLMHNALKFSAIRRAKGIICVSNNTVNDLNRYCPPGKDQKVEIIYNGVSDDYYRITDTGNGSELLSSLNVKDKFLLFVGARSSYKNFDFVIEMLKHLPGYQLVVVGNPLSEKEKVKIDKSVFNRIVQAVSISNEKLNILYNYAHALLYPSSYEGFGFPIIEAMKAGCPVLSLNATSIPEVAGGAAILFNTLDTTQFVQVITQLEVNDFKSKWVELGLKNATRFNWSKCNRETKQFYADISKQFN